MATSVSTSKKSTKPQTMAELLASSSAKLVIPKKGDVLEGVITVKQKRTLTVDFGAKTEGVVTGKEYDFASEYISDLKVGDKITAYVVTPENDRGQVVLSLKNAASEAKWDVFKDALEKETILEANGIDVNRGGLIVMVNGVRGFVPSSQFGRQLVGKFSQLTGVSFKVKAIEVDPETNRLIFSERHVSEAKELAAKEQALDNVKPGNVYEGAVSGVMHFGLFVTVEVPVLSAAEAAVVQDNIAKKSKKSDQTDDEVKKSVEKPADVEVVKAASKVNVGYVEGLVHISEISWEKVTHPKDYHRVGDKIRVKVLGIDEKTGKLNLSLKQLLDDPWVGIEERYPVGTTFTGTVTRMESFGAFVNAEPGIDGLIHNTKLDPSTPLQSGDEVTVTVENVSESQRRMSLSPVLTELPIGYK